MEKYNEDIRAELEAARNAANSKLDALNELERNGGKYKVGDYKGLKDSVSTDPDWKGNDKPVPVEVVDDRN